jgi:phosphoribosyl-AMP cyclohydrolase
MNNIIDIIKFNQDGLVPVIVQDYNKNDVLMLAYMNKESFMKTVETGKATFWSRSRQEFWIKGETSGNIQVVKEIYIDCDGDTILLKVLQLGDKGQSDYGAACHKGYRTCFFRKLKEEKWQIIGSPMFDPKDVYGK